jgi:MFS family permease
MPFFLDAATFAVSAALIAAISVTRRQIPVADVGTRPSWTTEAKEGFVWLWRHPLLRPMAIILGLFNALGSMVFAVMVLFAQEVLRTSSTEFAILMTGAAVGGVIGGWSASSLSSRLGEGPSLWAAIIVSGTTTLISGLVSQWPIVWLMFAISTVVGVLWNVITVSLRQSIIPDNLLGRVNSVYRLFAWGMIPVGAIIGGALVTLTEGVGGGRELALRMPLIASGVGHFLLLAWAAPKLTSAKISKAREAAPVEA